MLAVYAIFMMPKVAQFCVALFLIKLEIRPTPRLLVCAVHDGHDQEVVAPTVGLLTERVFILGDTWLGLFALVSVDSAPVR